MFSIFIFVIIFYYIFYVFSVYMYITAHKWRSRANCEIWFSLYITCIPDIELRSSNFAKITFTNCAR